MAASDLRTFIAELRVRLARGDFRDQRDLRLCDEITLADVELAVQVLLADVDFYANMPPAQREQHPWKGQRERLADTLRRLQGALAWSAVMPLFVGAAHCLV
jgi:hypothetical protein